jgi:hypothetical protein
MEPTDSEWSRKYAIARAHINANGQGETFVVAFNKDKSESILCCPLEKFQKEHPFGLAEEDIFYRAEPGMPVPAEIT